MRQFGQERARQSWLRLQPFDELAGDLREQRGTAAVFDEIATTHGLPFVGVQYPQQHRETAGQQPLQIVEQQLAVDLQAAGFQSFRCRNARGVTQMPGQRPLLVLQAHAGAPALSRIRRTCSSSWRRSA